MLATNFQLIKKIKPLAKYKTPDIEQIIELAINGQLDLEDEETLIFLLNLNDLARFMYLCLAHRFGRYQKNPTTLAYKLGWISKQYKDLLNVITDYWFQIWNLIVSFWDDYIKRDPLIAKYCPNVENEFDLFKEIFAQEFRVEVFRFANCDFLAPSFIEKTYRSIRSGMQKNNFDLKQLEAYKFIYDRNRYYCQLYALLNGLFSYEKEDQRLKLQLDNLVNIEKLIVDRKVCWEERFRKKNLDFYEKQLLTLCPRCMSKRRKDGKHGKHKDKERYECTAKQCSHKTVSPLSTYG